MQLSCVSVSFFKGQSIRYADAYDLNHNFFDDLPFAPIFNVSKFLVIVCFRDLLMTHAYRGAIALALCLYSMMLYASDPLPKIIQTHREGNQAEVDVQREIDALSDRRRALFEEYDTLSRELNALSSNNAQLQRRLDDQGQQRQVREQALEELTKTRQEIEPLLLDMVGWLEQLAHADLPYRVQERQQAMVALQRDLDRGDLDLGARYERVLGHYSDAMARGREVDVDSGPSPDHPEHVVDFLKVGRLALYYQSPDGQRGGFWDAEGQQWDRLNKSENVALMRALRIVRQEMPPDLLRLPLQAPSAVEQEVSR